MKTEIQLSPGLRGGPNLLGPLGIRLTEDGELIRAAAIEVGKSHRGVELCMERVPFVAASIYSDKIDFLAAPACNLAFARAVERIAGIEVPQRAEMIRGILLELNRISSHLFYIAQIATLLGARTVSNICFREREKVCDIFEMYCGSRMGFHSVRIGGAADDITEGLVYRIEGTLVDLKSFLEELDAIFLANPIVRNRMDGLAVLSGPVCRHYGLSGPNARASGISEDLRIERPEGAYSHFRIEPMLDGGFSGDAFSRLQIRVREVHQSIDLLREMVLRVPGGNYRISIGGDFVAPPGDAYEEVEGPRGRLGVFVVSDGGATPARVSFSAPSLSALAAVPDVMVGEIVNDAELILGSFDISISEVDK